VKRSLYIIALSEVTHFSFPRNAQVNSFLSAGLIFIGLHIGQSFFLTPGLTITALCLDLRLFIRYLFSTLSCFKDTINKGILIIMSIEAWVNIHQVPIRSG